MNDERSFFSLACTDPATPAPVLTDVQVKGRLDAVLFDLTLRQTYRNASDQVLEVVYTFPLPPMGVLLGFASELNGEREEGVVVAKCEAERTYEESLAEGDAPVMLEPLGNGLHTANIGNLKPGEEIVLETRFAQVLAFEQGRLRLSIPTTIAPRYGNAERAGLQPQQVPVASIDAVYPLTMSLTVGEALAGAVLACPTHRFTTSKASDGTRRLELAPGAMMDRDVVVTVTPAEALPSLLVRAKDTHDPSAPLVAMAALQVPSRTPREQIAIKLLVDCSGSMNGDSISSARAALLGVIVGLTGQDRVSLARFGSGVEQLHALTRATPQSLRHLRGLVDGILANMGGTEMAAALSAAFEHTGDAELAGGDVLLITDGEVWEAGPMVAAARQSGHRVFAIGVGSAPTEGVLRDLAEATGGACEFATPGESLEAAALRMLHRIRQPVLKNARIEWGGPPAWTSGPTASIFGGDTVLAFAGFSHGNGLDGARLLGTNESGTPEELARAEADAPCPGDTLARIGAARRVADTDTDAETALALALRYQLMSDQTNCILVHERAAADKATAPAKLHQVSSMLVAGWGGLGSANRGAAMSAPMQMLSPMPVLGPMPSPESFGPENLFGAPKVDVDSPASLAAMAEFVGDHLADDGQLQDLASSCATFLTLHADTVRALEVAVALGLTPDEAWVLLADWANTRPGGLADAQLASLLAPLLAGIGSALAEKARNVFESQLGCYSNASWILSRAQRLRRALR